MKGFTPQVFWATHGGETELEEKACFKTDIGDSILSDVFFVDSLVQAIAFQDLSRGLMFFATRLRQHGCFYALANFIGLRRIAFSKMKKVLWLKSGRI